MKTQDSTDTPKDAPREDSAAAYVANTINQTLPDTSEQPDASKAQGPGAVPFQTAAEQPGSWDLIALGLEEPLPPQEVMDDLYGHAATCRNDATDTWQIPNLLFQSSSHNTHYTQTTLSRSAQPRPPYASTGMSAIHYVDHGSLRHRQIRGTPRAFLPPSQKVCAHGRDERAWGNDHYACTLPGMDSDVHIRV